MQRNVLQYATASMETCKCWLSSCREHERRAFRFLIRWERGRPWQEPASIPSQTLRICYRGFPFVYLARAFYLARPATSDLIKQTHRLKNCLDETSWNDPSFLFAIRYLVNQSFARCPATSIRSIELPEVNGTVEPRIRLLP